MEAKLTALLFLPLLGSLFCLVTASWERLSRIFALVLSFSLFFLSLTTVTTPAPFFSQQVFYVFSAQATKLAFSLGLDGLSSWLIVLTTFLLFPALTLTLSQKNFSTIASLLFFLVFALVGVFSATDLFLFYLFWEISLLPLFFLIGLYGTGQKIYAALKFFLFTFAGSVFLLAGILVMLFTLHPPSLQWQDLILLKLPRSQQVLLSLLFAAAFLVKIPVFPFHTWLPDAHTEAHTTGSVFLAGVLLKMGVYGFLRWIFPLFPQGMAFLSPYLIWAAVLGAIYTGLVCYVQCDMKRLIAYSSVAHMGFVVLGFSSLHPLGLQGSFLQTINHGISTGGLFLLIGMIYERRHTRQIQDFGGLSQVMPRYATIFFLFVLSSLGLPGLNSFPGEFLIFLGAFHRNILPAFLSLFSVFLSALYLLTLYKNVFHGSVRHKENEALQDLDLREWLTIVPVVVVLFVFGFFPQILLSSFQSYLKGLLLP